MALFYMMRPVGDESENGDLTCLASGRHRDFQVAPNEPWRPLTSAGTMSVAPRLQPAGFRIGPPRLSRYMSRPFRVYAEALAIST